MSHNQNDCIRLKGDTAEDKNVRVRPKREFKVRAAAPTPNRRLDAGLRLCDGCRDIAGVFVDFTVLRRE